MARWLSHPISSKAFAFRPKVSTSEGSALWISAIVFVCSTSTLRRAAVPQSHRRAKNTLRNPEFADRSILNPSIGARCNSDGRAETISRFNSASPGTSPFESDSTWGAGSSMLPLAYFRVPQTHSMHGGR